MCRVFDNLKQDVIDALRAGPCRSGRTMFEPERTASKSFVLVVQRHGDTWPKTYLIHRHNIDETVGRRGIFTHAELADRVEAGDFDVIGFRLHDTNVVEFNPRGDCRINWYDSRTTRAFIRDYAPNWLRSGASTKDYRGECAPDPIPPRFRKAGVWLAKVEYGGGRLAVKADGVWLREPVGYGLCPMLVDPLDERACWTHRVERWQLTAKGKAEMKRRLALSLPALDAARQAFVGAQAAGVPADQWDDYCQRAYQDVLPYAGPLEWHALAYIRAGTHRDWLRRETAKQMQDVEWSTLHRERAHFTTGEVKEVNHD